MRDDVVEALSASNGRVVDRVTEGGSDSRVRGDSTDRVASSFKRGDAGRDVGDLSVEGSNLCDNRVSARIRAKNIDVSVAAVSSVAATVPGGEASAGASSESHTDMRLGGASTNSEAEADTSLQEHSRRSLGP